MTKPYRYYAEFRDLAKRFESRFQGGWQVFDRESLSKEGEAMAIAFCVSRDVAYAIRDALNQEEKAQAR